MNEFIISSEQLKTATEAYLEHELSRSITEVFISGDKLPKIVRCRDCRYYTYADAEHGNNDWCTKHEHIAWSVNGFCAWGRRGEPDE